MAVKLMKLAMNATTTTTPTVARYFYTATAEIPAAGSVAATSFTDDTSAAVTEFEEGPAGYYSLYVNGALQEQNAFTISTSQLTLATGVGPIAENALIILVKNEATSSTTITS